MRTRLTTFFLFTAGVTAASFLAVTVTTYAPPPAAPIAVVWGFFISLFCLLTVITGITWFNVKRILFSRFAAPAFFPALRQAALFSLILVIAAFFNSLHILTLWELLPLAIAAILLEFTFQADPNPPITPNS